MTSTKNVKLGVGILLFVAALSLNLNYWVEFGLFFASYIIIGGEVLLKAFRNISKGKVFDENFLMGIATIGAFLIGEFPEGVAVMIFYQIGEYLPLLWIFVPTMPISKSATA